MDYNLPKEVKGWIFEQSLGVGGFGAVYLYKSHNQKVAIKKYENITENSTNAKFNERWIKEIELMTEIVNHENIVKGLKVEPADFVETLRKLISPKLPILVMEYCELGDLRRLLNRVENSNGIPEKEVKCLLKSLRNAISYLHCLNIVHRDIKPENIVMTRSNGETVYKLTDLGYAKSMNETTAASFVGTFEYIAPELLQSDKYSRTVDYWSLGIIAYEVICGIRPFIPHQSLSTWVVEMRKKKSDCIAITQDNDGKLFYHTEISYENSVSPSLKKLLEAWLRLPLETNGKQRGSTFEKITANGGTEDSAPKQALQIFTALDKILELKILTAFCLFSYRFISIVIDSSMSLRDLKETISKETGIESTEIYIVLPLEQDKILKIDENTTKPIDLFMDNFHDLPMIYIVRQGFPMKPDLKPHATELLKKILENKSILLKPFIQIQAAKQTLFFARNENRLYKTCLMGFKNYSMCLNDEIEKIEIKTLNNNVHRLTGALQLYQITLPHTKEKLKEKSWDTSYSDTIAKWDVESDKIKEHVLQLLEVNENISKRYQSVLRRSRDIINHIILKNQDEEPFDLKPLEKHFKHLKDLQLKKGLEIQRQKEVFDLMCQCLKRRDRLLVSSEFRAFQMDLSGIHVEYAKIKKIISEANLHVEKTLSDVYNINLQHHKHLWQIVAEKCSEIRDHDTMMTRSSLSHHYREDNTFSFDDDVQNLLKINERTFESWNSFISNITNDI